MKYRRQQAKAAVIEGDIVRQSKSPFSGSSLVPMLVTGLVLTFAGMIAALLLS